MQKCQPNTVQPVRKKIAPKVSSTATLAAKTLKAKARRNKIQTKIESLSLNRLEQKLIQALTDRVVENVHQIESCCFRAYGLITTQ